MAKKKSEQPAGSNPEIEALKRKSTRMDAIAALGEAGVVEAVEPLLRLYKQSRKKERAAICRALAQIGVPAIEILIDKGLGSKDSDVRRCALRVLGALGPEARPPIEPLLQCLGDKDDRVRLEAIDALGQIGGEGAAEPLVGLLDAEDKDVRERAADALGALGEAVAEQVGRVLEEEGSPRARFAAARALGQMGLPAAEAALCRALEEPFAPPSLRVVILAALGETLGDKVVPLASAMLGSEDRGLRRQAVRCLRGVKTPESTARLMALYEDEDKKLRRWVQSELLDRHEELLARIQSGEWEVLPVLWEAWQAVGRRQGGEASDVLDELAAIGPALVPALVILLARRTARDESAPNVEAIQILARMGSQAGEAYEALVAQLDHPDVETRCAAARALGALADERAVPVLAERLQVDADEFTGKKAKRRRRDAMTLQEAAAEGLGRLGKAALPAAMGAARSGDTLSRRGGLIALGYIGGGRALSTLDRALSDPDPMVREVAAEAMERAAATDVHRLGKLLQNEDERVRAKAVRALGKLEDLASLDLLLRAYGDTSRRVSKAVVDALARRKGVRAYSVLIAAAAGGNVRAIQALAEHPQPQAIPALLTALDSPWTEVYAVALEAIHRYADVFRADSDALAALREAIPELSGLLHDDSAKIRRLALEVLGVFGDPATVQRVAYLLLDPKRHVRLAAVRLLASIGNQEAVAALRAGHEGTKDEEVRDAIEDALEDLEGEHDDEIEDSLEDLEDEHDDEDEDAPEDLKDEHDDDEDEDTLENHEDDPDDEPGD